MNAVATKPSIKLPAIVVVLGVTDGGPMDGGGGTCCPHCGAEGRYITTFLCEDGTRRGAMAGCMKLFPQSTMRESKLVQQAFARAADAERAKKKLAGWWQEMIDACALLGKTECDRESIQNFRNAVNAANNRRIAWLNKNGYGKWMK